MASGFSISPKNAVVGGGLFGPGRAKIIKARYGKFDYKNKAGVATRKPVTAMLLTFKRGDEKQIESYTVGDGFNPSKDGLRLVPLGGQTGLTDTCKTMRFFKSLADHGMPEAAFEEIGTDISKLESMIVTLTRKTLPKISGRGKGRDSDREPTILLVDDIHKAPWELDAKANGDDDEEDDDVDEKGKKDDDDDDEDDDDEKDEKKKKGTKSKGSDDDDDEAEDTDDDDDDEKEKDDDEDEADDDDDEDLTEEAGEKLIDALADGDLKLAKVQDAVTAHAKKDKKTKAKAGAIGKFAASVKFLKKETGWSFDGKTVTAD